MDNCRPNQHPHSMPANASTPMPMQMQFKMPFEALPSTTMGIQLLQVEQDQTITQVSTIPMNDITISTPAVGHQRTHTVLPSRSPSLMPPPMIPFSSASNVPASFSDNRMYIDTTISGPVYDSSQENDSQLTFTLTDMMPSNQNIELHIVPTTTISSNDQETVLGISNDYESMPMYWVSSTEPLTFEMATDNNTAALDAVNMDQVNYGSYLFSHYISGMDEKISLFFLGGKLSSWKIDIAWYMSLFFSNFSLISRK